MHTPISSSLTPHITHHMKEQLVQIDFEHKTIAQSMKSIFKFLNVPSCLVQPEIKRFHQMHRTHLFIVIFHSCYYGVNRLLSQDHMFPGGFL